MNKGEILQDQYKSLDYFLSQEKDHSKEIDKAVINIKQMTQEMKDELITQLKEVTDELAMQLAIRFNEPYIEEIKQGNPIVKKAIETIEKYETKGK